jgi:hypothetical protein
MEKKAVTIFGYELWTQKFMGNKVDLDRFDFEVVEYLMKKIVSDVPLQQRAYRKKNKMINLISVQDSSDQDFLEGVFTTARYGKEQTIINVPDQTEAGRKEKDHGVLNEVHFTIHKETGLLLIEKDSESVARGGFIQSFLRYHKELMYDYIQKFNDDFTPNKMYKRNFLKVVSLPSKSFFDEIEEFASIKDAYYYKDIEKDTGVNNEASNILYLYQQAKEKGVKNVSRVKVSFENRVRKDSIKDVKAFFEMIHESKYYDGIGLSGKLYSGRFRTIELENIQRSFDVKVEHHENGLPKLDDLINEMINLSKFENPIEYKEDIEQFKGVMDDEEEDKIG